MAESMESVPRGEKDEEWLEYLRKGLKSDLLNDKAEDTKDTSSQNGKPPQPKRPAFEARTQISPRTSLPDELWLTVLECPCTFPSEIFSIVMLNLVKNPNITSSHLFRADIFYDSGQDHLFQPEDPNPYQGLAKHLKDDCQPIPAQWPGFVLERTIVRQLVPRNPQLDRPLVQTCHFFRTHNKTEQQSIVLYIPHVKEPEEVPFYHPAVSQLAFLHTWEHSSPTDETQQGHMTLLYHPFEGTSLTTKLSRTALKLLQTIHKHGQGQLLGYEKRVHLDRIIPQKRYQDTYTRLKAKYGKQLSQQWVEVTDPGKHVFEDIAIAAFLIELWRDMYSHPADSSTTTTNSHEKEKETTKPPFPGFTDIGCGNGILVYILLSESYPGFGFDARQRKTWSIFPPSIQDHLSQRILVPGILQKTTESEKTWHDGNFPRGTFIISNHADELTPWTPLLAYLNESAFIAIPCCSHDLSGARFRAPLTSKGVKEASQKLPQQQIHGDDRAEKSSPNRQAAETGSLKRTEAQKKMPSAYSTLCSYVGSLATELGFQPEEEVLRIPSTRNTAILGRYRSEEDETPEGRNQVVIEVIERELKRSITAVADDWIANAQKLMKKPSSGH